HDSFENWEDAVRASCQPLIEDKTIEPIYIQTVIDCIHKYGPYIVIAPDIAMPHANEGATGVNDTSISFMKVEKAVHFDLDDPEKDARLFFVLASVDHEKHLSNMMQLCEMLMNQELVDALLTTKSAEDLLAVQRQFLP
ncbi:MAG TPA: PTS sugar transporter subunit IIA, partial [Clostridiaceae bacterium]|nr:PTS sugar transporter subunit IIA [Clostridiaceae bacterium]